MKIKEKFFDRFDQSFKLMKNNFVGLIVPVFVYNLLALIVFDIIIGTFFTSKIGSLQNIENFNIGVFLSDPAVVTMIAVGMFMFLLYLLLYIVILLSILKSIKQSVAGEKINIQENISYGFSRFFSSMSVYWYVFAYIYLIPAIVFIVGGILLNMGLYKNIDALTYTGGGIMIMSVLILIPFAIYRGTKAKFAFYSAIDNDSFEKENFNYSVSITNRDWWRIFGNIFLVGLLVSFGTSTMEATLGFILFGASGGGSAIFSGITEAIKLNDPETAIASITEYAQNKSMFYDLFGNIFSIVLKSVGTVYVFTFIYLFYLRMCREDEYFKNKGQQVIVGDENQIEVQKDINRNI